MVGAGSSWLLSSLQLQPVLAAEVPGIAAPALPTPGPKRDAIARLLSRVPAFVVTNKQSAPYLTERDSEGRRSGFFFLAPDQALGAFKEIKQFDPSASLSVVPLDSVYFDIARSKAELEAAPQPKAGTSTDLKLFSLQPIEAEVETAKKSLKRQGKKALAPGRTPLFYDEDTRLTVEGEEQQPYFFRYEDWKNARISIGGKEPAESEVRVVDLEEFISTIADADSSQVVLAAASDAAAVVERIGVGSTPVGGETTPPDEKKPERQLAAPESKGVRRSNKRMLAGGEADPIDASDPGLLAMARSTPFGGGPENKEAKSRFFGLF